MTLLDDWRAFREGRADFDKCHFLALFKEHSQPHEIEQILAGFRHSAELARRTSQVLEAGTLPYLYLLPKERGTPAQLIEATHRWLDVQAKFFQQTGDQQLLALTRDIPIVFKTTEELRVVENFDVPGTWAREAIGDAVFDARDCHNPVDYALFEAWYGIAADYDLSWYIAQPLIPLDIDFQAYFELWRLGGEYLLLEGECRVAQQPRTALR